MRQEARLREALQELQERMGSRVEWLEAHPYASCVPCAS